MVLGLIVDGKTLLFGQKIDNIELPVTKIEGKPGITKCTNGPR